jgi:serine/threonine-protein kinase HipA
MRTAKIYYNNQILAGLLIEVNFQKEYLFEYDKNYDGPPVSLTMPIAHKIYNFDKFPPYFEGVLPEGSQLQALLKLEKLDTNDYFGQLVCVGKDLVGAFSVKLD